MTKLQKTVLILMAAAMAVLLIAASVVFFTRQTPAPIINEFTPPAFDPAAQSGIPDAPPSYSMLELKETAVISMCANISLENNAAQVFFTSHEGNQGWMKIKLLDDQGKLLGESGLVRPGEYLQAVTLAQVPKEAGLISAKILIYEPDTYLSLGSASVEVMLVK